MKSTKEVTVYKKDLNILMSSIKDINTNRNKEVLKVIPENFRDDLFVDIVLKYEDEFDIFTLGQMYEIKKNIEKYNKTI